MNLYAKNMATILTVMLSMAPRVPNNIVAYRLVCDDFIRSLIENNKKEMPTIEKGFISTSLVKSIVNSDEAYSFPNGYFRLIKKPYNEGNKMVYECELFYF